MSWEVTLGTVVAVGAVFGIGVQYLASDLLDELVGLFVKLPRVVSEGVSEAQARDMLLGYFAMGQAYVMIGGLALARWWQSLLYNPGGFQKEIHGLRLPKGLGLGIVALMVAAFATQDLAYMKWIPLLTVPMIVCAIGLVHWVVKRRKMNAGWLALFYVFLVGLNELANPLLTALALLDSWMDLRQKIETNERDNEV